MSRGTLISRYRVDFTESRALCCTWFIRWLWMEEPVSEDAQWIIVRLSTIMEPFTIATYTGVSRHRVDQILATFRRTRSVENTQFVPERMHDAADIYLEELRAELELQCERNFSTSSIWRMLRRAGFTMKKLTPIARERIARHRSEYGARIGSYTPDQLVFVMRACWTAEPPIRVVPG